MTLVSQHMTVIYSEIQEFTMERGLIHMHLFIHMYISMQNADVAKCIFYRWINRYIHIERYIHTYIHTYIYTYTHTHTHTHLYIHTHTYLHKHKDIKRK